MQYQIKKGDSLIKIARQFGLNSLDEIIRLNNIQDPNLIREGDILELPGEAPAVPLQGTTVTAQAPDYTSTAYADLPDSVRSKVDAYAQAIKDHRMNINQVPALYRQQAYKQSIRSTMNNAGPEVVDKVLLFPFKMADIPVRATLNEGRKLITGDDSYGINDYFGHFSFMGKDFEQEHPVADVILNASATPLVSSIGSRAAVNPNYLRTVASNIKNNAAATGEMTVGHMAAPKPTGGVPVRNGASFTSGVKGYGKTGTVIGNRPKTSSKGTFSHSSSYVKGKDWETVNPTFVYTPVEGGTVLPPVLSPMPASPVPYQIQEPVETHIEHTEPANPWIYNTTPTVTVPYKVGMEQPVYYELEAPRGNSVSEQPIMEDTVVKKTGNKSRTAQEVAGATKGTRPSNTYFSQYGYGEPVIIVKKRGGFLPRK